MIICTEATQQAVSMCHLGKLCEGRKVKKKRTIPTNKPSTCGMSVGWIISWSLLLLFCLFVTLRGFGDLSSLTRNWTHPLGIESRVLITGPPRNSQCLFFFKPRLISFVFWRVLWSSFMSQLLFLQYTKGCFISYLTSHLHMDSAVSTLHPGGMLKC